MSNNKTLMNRFVQFINTADEKLAVELISQEAKFYVPGQSEPMRGPSGYLAIISMMRLGFSNIKWELKDLIAEGEKIAARFTMRGTHDGTFFNVPPTGITIDIQAINFYLFENGKIIEEYGQPDLLSLLVQIGAMPKA